GYDFGEFDPKNFIYSEDLQRIYISGMVPFMEVTMNPWFIPEKGVEGFEFIMMGREAEHNRETVLETKKKCKAQLIKQAEEREILKKARENAEENLKAFISLMMDVEIESVQIYESTIDSYRDFFAEDDTLSLDEFSIVEKEFLKNAFSGELKREELRELNSFIDYLDWIKKNTDVRYSKQGFVEQIADDGLLDLTELAQLQELRVTAFDSLWYGASYLSHEMRDGDHVYILKSSDENELSKNQLRKELENDLRQRVRGVQYVLNDTLRTGVDAVRISEIIGSHLENFSPEQLP
ncbi:MAG: hypothetical protein WBG42_04740, partial [Cryomorphaceae bacterium]